MFRSLIIGTSVCLMLIITGKDAFCAEVIPVIISKNASELERLAARELSDQWSRLFGVTIEIRHQWAEQDKKVILLGQLERKINSIFKLTDQQTQIINQSSIAIPCDNHHAYP